MLFVMVFWWVMVTILTVMESIKADTYILVTSIVLVVAMSS
jgi:hypothetical protein